MRELARALHLHLTQFTERLHHTRDRLEDTARCYHLLDKVGTRAVDGFCRIIFFFFHIWFPILDQFTYDCLPLINVVYNIVFHDIKMHIDIVWRRMILKTSNSLS